MPRSAKIASSVGVLLVVALLVFLCAVTRFTTAPDQVGLHYSAGPLSATKFENCIGSSQRVWDGPADKHYAYPAGLRTYDFSTNSAHPDSKPFVVATVDNQELTVSGVVSFKLTTDCKALRKFHEQIGNKYDAAMDGDATSAGWNEMLSVYMNQPLQRAMNQATQGLGWKALYNDPKTKDQWEKEVTALLPEYIKHAMGGEYFDDFSLTLQKPEPSKQILSSLENQQVAVEDNIAQQEKNKTVKTETQSIKELVNILGPDGYNVYQGIKSGKVTVMPIPEGSSVVVNGGK